KPPAKTRNRRSMSIPTCRTHFTPIIVPATARKRRRMGGSECWLGLPNTAWLDVPRETLVITTFHPWNLMTSLSRKPALYAGLFSRTTPSAECWVRSSFKNIGNTFRSFKSREPQAVRIWADAYLVERDWFESRFPGGRFRRDGETVRGGA